MDDRIKDAARGAGWGAFVGAMVGLGVCTWFIDEPPFFAGDTIVIGASVLGLLGYVYGDPVIDWVKDNWTSFT